MLFELESNDFHLYGKSTQDGTPSPINPVPIVNLYDGEELKFKVKNEMGITYYRVTLENGLCGIPVTDSRLSNHTDDSGQMWCCDEIDLERGVYIKRTKLFNPLHYNPQFYIPDNNIMITTSDVGALSGSNGLCNRLVYNNFRPSWGQYLVGKYFQLYPFDYTIHDGDDEFVVSYLMTHDYQLLVILATPIEIPLDTFTVNVDYHARMNSYYPEVIRTIKEFQAIIYADYPEFENLEVAKENIINNAHLSTMTESRIVEWEKLLGISYVEGSTLDDRRDTIKARIRGKGKLNTSLINDIVKTFTGGTANSWVEDSILYVEITPPPTNKQYIFANVEQELAKKIPAHLGFKVSRNYYDWKDVSRSNATWQDVKDNYDTWVDVFLFTPFR